MKDLVLSALLVSALVLTACSASERAVSGVAPGQGQSAKAAAPKPVLARVFEADVDEKNLLLGSEQAAKDYLRQKLLASVVERLGRLGFDGNRSVALATAGRLEAFTVRGHQERIFGKGAEAGRIQDMVIWDVQGKLRLVLSDQDVADLGSVLAALSLGSLEEIETVERFIKPFAELFPNPQKLAELRQHLGDRWADTLGPYLKTQLEVPVGQGTDYQETLSRVAVLLSLFHSTHPDHPGFPLLEKEFTLGALKQLHTIEVKPENHDAIQNLLSRLSEMAKEAMPTLLPYLWRDLELAWRDRIEKLDDAKVPFPQLRKDFLLFMQDFPKSDFYPELELRFLARWVEHLLPFHPKDLAELSAFVDEVALLAERFPKFPRLEEVRGALGGQCVQVLAQIEISDLGVLAKAKEVVARCDAVMPAGMDTMAMREHISQREDLLNRERDDRAEREALKDLTFFLDWDQRIAKLAWGGKRANWLGQSEFAKKWAEGADAANSCHCSLDPEDPCRVFEAEGPHGGFEVVARFYLDRLLGVDLCQVYTGSDISAIYRFFARRYSKAHDKAQAAEFLAGSGNRPASRAVSFGQRPGLVVTLERSADSCSVHYRSGALLAEQEKADREARDNQKKEVLQARRERLKRGWKVGDCVQWECQQNCAYHGKVKARGEGRYQVTVTAAEEDQRSLGTDLWVREQEIRDCASE